MKAVLLNGARSNEPHIDQFSHDLSNAMQEWGWELSAYTLREHKIGYCIGCFDCWTKTPGECIIRDDNPVIAAEIVNSDLQILLTPITFGGYSAELKRMVDHMIPLISPFFRRIDGEVHHHQRYASYPDLLGIGYLPAPCRTQEDIFHTLISHNATNLGDARGFSTVFHANTPPTEVLKTICPFVTQNIEAVS